MLRLALAFVMFGSVAGDGDDVAASPAVVPEGTVPVMVQRLTEARATTAPSSSPSLSTVEKAQFVSDEAKLAEVRQQQSEQLKAIQTQLLEGYRQRDNLLLTQKLMTVGFLWPGVRIPAPTAQE